METPRVTVRRHEGGDSRWESAERGPGPRLRGAVLAYQDYSEKAPTAMRRLEVPFAGVPVIISFGGSFRIEDPRSRTVETLRNFAAGLTESWVIVESEDESRGMQINFTPIGARLFLGLPMAEITNRAVDLETLLGPTIRHLAERLLHTPGHEERFAILDDFIERRIAHAGEPSVPVVWAWNRLRATGGRAAVSDIAGELGYSHKHLISQFRDHLGLPPKTMSRILRFHRAVELIRGAGERRWSDIAYESGYYDQAHFNRDFREFSGRTPREFAARVLPHRNGVLGD